MKARFYMDSDWNWAGAEREMQRALDLGSANLDLLRNAAYLSARGAPRGGHSPSSGCRGSGSAVFLDSLREDPRFIDLLYCMRLTRT